MLGSLLLITYRSLLKNKLFILTNIFGMGVAIAQCIVGFFAWSYDATFDDVHANRDEIFRVSSMREFEGNVTRYGMAPLPLGEIVDKTFPDVRLSSRYFHSYSNFKIDHDLFPGNLHYVDPEFFDMFTFEFLAGSGAALNDKTSILISKEMAIRLFGDVQSAYGKSITQVYGQNLKEVNVAGVFADPPMNSSFFTSGKGCAFMGFENCKDEHPSMGKEDWKLMTTLFVMIPDAGRVHSVQSQLQAFRENNNKVREDFQVKEFTLDQLRTMAHVDRSEDIRTATWGAPPISAVIGSNIMGILVLLLACFNLTNTSIAISSRRLKEIGIRKVMGSTRKNLIAQHIGETMLICLLAVLLGLLLSDAMVRGWNLMWGYFALSPDYLNSTFLVYLAGVLIFAALAAGSYPAFYISKFDPVIILKGTQQFGGTNYFTRTLLAGQLAISLISIVCAVGFLQNANFQRQYDLGFDVRGCVIAWVNSENEFETYRNAILQDPAVISVAGARSGIFSNRSNDPVKSDSRQLDVDIIEVGDEYLNTLGLQLVSGRNFTKDSKTDQQESVIITRKLADEFGWDDALGKQLVWHDTVKLYVVGVVKNVHTMGLWRELEPMMIRFVLPERYSQLVVSTSAEHVPALFERMNQEWNTLFPNRLYNGRRLDDDLQQVNEININIVYMFGFMGVITLLLSATGMYTLVSLNIIKRTKEIGVRKVLGASVINIARKVNTEFVIILGVAGVLGSFGGYFFSSMIMGSIWRYYQGPGAVTFILSTFALFVVSLASIEYKIYRAATMNPVESLKVE